MTPRLGLSFAVVIFTPALGSVALWHVYAASGGRLWQLGAAMLAGGAAGGVCAVVRLARRVRP